MKIYSELKEKYTKEFELLSEQFTDEDINYTENKLLLAIDKAYTVITKYLNYTGEKTEDYIIPTITLAETYFLSDKLNKELVKGDRPITQMSQGSRSVTYGRANKELDSNGLTEEVKALLPLLLLRVI